MPVKTTEANRYTHIGSASGAAFFFLPPPPLRSAPEGTLYPQAGQPWSNSVSSPVKPQEGQRTERKVLPQRGQSFARRGTSAPQFSQKKEGLLMVSRLHGPPILHVSRSAAALTRSLFSAGFASFSGFRRSLGFCGGLRRGFLGFCRRRLSGSAFPFFVCNIKTGSLKDNPASAVYKTAYIFAALGTGFKRFVVHALKSIKGISAAFTFVFIRRHI